MRRQQTAPGSLVQEESGLWNVGEVSRFCGPLRSNIPTSRQFGVEFEHLESRGTSVLIAHE